jgi:preprotein translocase subunit SecD
MTLGLCRFWALFAGLLAVGAAVEGCTKPQVGAVLTYQLDTSGFPVADVEELQQTVGHVLSGRIGDLGRVELLDDNTVRLHLYGEIDDFKLDAARRLATAPGNLQFRILASKKIGEHAETIESAMVAPASQRLIINDQPAAQWVECAPQEFREGNVAFQQQMVVREEGGRKLALALLDDGLNVTGDYLQSVATDLDETGRPQIVFEFIPEGAALFGQLTGQHLPRADGVRYMLGIILDDVLLSAPTIESKITNRGRISGNMTQADLDAILPLFRSGALPCELREVNVARGEE